MKRRLQIYSGYLLAVILVALLTGIAIATAPGLFDFTQTGKFFYFTAGVLLLLPALVIHALKRDILRVTLADLFLVLLFACLAASRYLLHRSVCTTLLFTELAGLVIVYFAVRALPRNGYLLLYAAITVGASVEAGYGNLQNAGYFFSNNQYFSITGHFFNPGPFSGYLALAVPALIALFFEGLNRAAGSLRYRNLRRWLLYSGFMLLLLNIVMALYAAESRAACMATLAGAGFLLWFRCRLYLIQNLRKRPRLSLASGMIIMVLATIVVIKAYHFKQASADGRAVISQVTLTMIGHNPWTGVGFDQFKSAYMLEQAAYLHGSGGDKSGFVTDNVYAFNDLLQFIAENGLLGLIPLLLLFCTLIRKVSSSGPVIIAAQAGLLAGWLFSLFAYPSQILPIKLLMIVYAAVLVSDGRSWSTSWRIGLMPAVSLTLVSLITLVFFAFQLEQQTQVYQLWNKANAALQENSYSSAVNWYQQAAPDLSANGYFLQGYGHALLGARQYAAAIEVLQRATGFMNTAMVQADLGDAYAGIRLYVTAEQHYCLASAMLPGLFYPRYALVKLYYASGERAKALALSSVLLGERPRFDDLTYKEMYDEIKTLQGDPPKR